jgi:hypothetical protein
MKGALVMFVVTGALAFVGALATDGGLVSRDRPIDGRPDRPDRPDRQTAKVPPAADDDRDRRRQCYQATDRCLEVEEKVEAYNVDSPLKRNCRDRLQDCLAVRP